MPYYEYACPDCGHAFERRRAVAERNEPPGPCPACGQQAARLRMSLPALVGTRSDTAAGVCPSSGAPCGCAHAGRN